MYHFEIEGFQKNSIIHIYSIYTSNVYIYGVTIAKCPIGPLFFPLHYFYSFRDDLGDKNSKKNTDKSVDFLHYD